MQPVHTFAEFAAEFCSWAENEPSDGLDEAEKAVKLLSRLIALVHDLPDEFYEQDAPPSSHDEWLLVYKRFGSLPFNLYSCFGEPHEPNEPRPGIGDVADDLADIWRDIKGGLLLYNSGNHAAASWEWRESFNMHWGRHAASALYALQCWRS